MDGVGMALQRGRIIRFDVHKGFGFIAPDTGGEDVFVHASSLLVEPGELRPGSLVEFDTVESDQGIKALGVRLVAQTSLRFASADDDGELCDVVPPAEFMSAITDILLQAAPTLTGAQIVDVRTRLANYARDHRWLDV
jgi:cold shock CspA family protein